MLEVLLDNKLIESCKYLVSHGVNITHNSIFKTFQHSAISSDCGFIDFLLKKNVDINMKDNQGRTILDRLIEWQHDDAVELLVKYGAKTSDINLLDIENDEAINVHINFSYVIIY